MTNLTQSAFVGGELARALHGRTDAAKYHTGLALCHNWFVHAEGGVSNRAGFEFITEVKDSAREVRLIPFIYNASDSYVLEFGHLYIRVIRNGAQVESGGSPYEIVTPYQETDLPDLDFVQSGDVITIVHPGHAPRELIRIAHDNWTLSLITFASALPAPTNLASASAVSSWSLNTAYNNGDLVYNSNRYFRCYVAHTDTVGTHEPGVGSSWEDRWLTFWSPKKYKITAVNAAGEESLPSAEFDMADTGQLTWDAVPDAVQYYVYVEVNGVYSYEGRTATNSYTGSNNYVPDTAGNPPAERNLFAGADEYPSAVTYHDQRLVFGGSNNNPDTIWTSKTGSFHNLLTSSPSVDSDAITVTLVANQVNQIKHLISLEDLIVLTTGAEWRITSFDASFAFSTIRLKPQGTRGAGQVKPLVIGSTILYTTPMGSRIRDLQYSLEDNQYTGNDLTIFSSHLFKGHTIVSWAHQEEPKGIIWAVRDDGVLLGLTYQREHQVWAWHQHTTDGEFESVTVVPENGEHVLYAVARRAVQGADVRYIERMHSRSFDTVNEAFFVDSGLSYNGPATTTFGGLDHLEGRDVVALADGNVVRNFTVSSGSVTLPVAASVVHIGLPYTATLQTLSPPAKQVRGKMVNATQAEVAVEQTRGLWFGPDLDSMYEQKQREFEDWGEPTALADGFIEATLESTWQNHGQLYVQQLDPLPATILSISPDYDVSD
ncbi:MAG: hypothetical protein N0E44_18940 [Candidatus Thiodiazotropha lotti]|nr:hypothetical protein [Candidatus Thiodiazotropha lotti]MCW4221962.1 hypothetical protein [Candidatus Thiodiazotropha lotti]